MADGWWRRRGASSLLAEFLRLSFTLFAKERRTTTTTTKVVLLHSNLPHFED
jgi:hypothetical protein